MSYSLSIVLLTSFAFSCTSIVKEPVIDRGLAYANGTIRAAPKVKLDDNGYAGEDATYVDRTGWGNKSCGTSQATLELRIADCASVIGAEATWDGTVKGNSGQSQGTWKLVTRTGDLHSSGRAREVWRDERTGLLWSSLLAGAADNKTNQNIIGRGSGGGTSVDDNKRINWCKASGANKIAGNPAAGDDPKGLCDGAKKYSGHIWKQAPDDTPGDDTDNFQTTSGDAISACLEGPGFVNSDTISIAQGKGEMIDNAGKAGLGLSSTPSVAWRLPTVSDYKQANINGIRFVMPEMGRNAHYYVDNEWTASLDVELWYSAYTFTPSDGFFRQSGRASSYAVRCVGR